MFFLSCIFKETESRDFRETFFSGTIRAALDRFRFFSRFFAELFVFSIDSPCVGYTREPRLPGGCSPLKGSQILHRGVNFVIKWPELNVPENSLKRHFINLDLKNFVKTRSSFLQWKNDNQNFVSLSCWLKSVLFLSRNEDYISKIRVCISPVFEQCGSGHYLWEEWIRSISLRGMRYSERRGSRVSEYQELWIKYVEYISAKCGKSLHIYEGLHPERCGSDLCFVSERCG